MDGGHLSLALRYLSVWRLNCGLGQRPFRAYDGSKRSLRLRQGIRLFVAKVVDRSKADQWPQQIVRRRRVWHFDAGAALNQVIDAAQWGGACYTTTCRNADGGRSVGLRYTIESTKLFCESRRRGC